MSDLLRRQRALDKTMEKFRGRPFAWGETDCIRMARFHLKAMGVRKLPRIPAYDSALGAKGALESLGHATLESLFDSLLERVLPAKMLPGDIALMGGDEVFDAVVICLGEKVFGFHEDADGPVIISPLAVKAAYRG